MSSLPPSEVAYEEAHINQSQQAAGYGVPITFFVLALMAVCLRIISRRVQHSTIGLDDYLAVASMVTAIPFIAATLGEVKSGVGKHLLSLTSEDLIMQEKWEVVNLFSYTATITLVKLSILALLYRIFSTTSRRLEIIIIVLTIWICLWAIALYFAYGFQCLPFWRNWSLTDSCRVSLQLQYSASILNAVHDALMFILPQPTIWRLHLPPMRKLGVSAIFSIGFIATLMGILKITYIQGAPGDKHKLDVTYSVVPALIFNALEPLLAIICSSLSVTPVFFQQLHLAGTSIVVSLLGSIRRDSSRSHISPQGSRQGDNDSLKSATNKQQLRYNSTQPGPDSIQLPKWPEALRPVGPQAV